MAVTLVGPSVTAETTPFPSTVATLVLLDDHEVPDNLRAVIIQDGEHHDP